MGEVLRWLPGNASEPKLSGEYIVCGFIGLIGEERYELLTVGGCKLVELCEQKKDFWNLKYSSFAELRLLESHDFYPTVGKITELQFTCNAYFCRVSSVAYFCRPKYPILNSLGESCKIFSSEIFFEKCKETAALEKIEKREMSNTFIFRGCSRKKYHWSETVKIRVAIMF